MCNANIAEKYMEYLLILMSVHVPDKHIRFNWIIQLLQNIYLLSGKYMLKKYINNKILLYILLYVVDKIKYWMLFHFTITINDVKIKHRIWRKNLDIRKQ